MKTPKLIINRGLPASGKTTHTQYLIETGAADLRVNRDDLRASLYGTRNEPKGRFNSSREKLTRTLRDKMILEGLSRGLTVVSDDTNLVPSTFEHVKSLAHEISGATVEVNDSFLKRTLRQCIEADSKRTLPVGADVIRDMWTKYVQPTLPPQDPTKRHAIICDLDGTLAVLNGRDPYDASTCEKDGVNGAVLKILLQYQGYIYFVSGREEKDRMPTLRYLFSLGFDTNRTKTEQTWSLSMRPTGDTRKDSIIKEEIFQRIIEPVSYIDFVLDDRDHVVDMWRGLGLNCFQVGYGNF